MALHATIPEATFQAVIEEENGRPKRKKDAIIRHWLLGHHEHRARSVRSGITRAAHDEGFSVRFGEWSEAVVKHIVIRSRSVGFYKGVVTASRDAEKVVRLRDTLPFWLYARSVGRVIH